MSAGAKKIIDGLKQAAQHAVCEHDWELREGTTGKPMKLVYECPYCLSRQTVFKNAHET